MSAMIHNLNVVGNDLTEVQQILGYTARLAKSRISETYDDGQL